MSRSAYGLFRATGKRPKSLQMFDDLPPAPEKPARAEDDFTPTPPEPTLALCHYERAALSRYPLIWEPACGDGRMQRDLEACGHRTIGSDLRDRGCGAQVKDFFAFDTALAPCIVTNPPYDKVNGRDSKGAWIEQAMGRLEVDYMALLLNWSWPGAAALCGMWRRFTPSRVWLMRWKVDFTGQGAPPMLNGWFIWDRLAPPPAPGMAMMGMMDRVVAGQEAML